MARARRWCLTLNNYTCEEYETLLKHPCPYKVLGREVGKEGTPHIQGYMEFKTAMRFNAVRKLSMRAHWETAHKPEKAAEYCKKEKNFIEEGTPSWKRSGYRTDLEATRAVAAEDGMRGIVGTASFQQIRCAEVYLKYCEEIRDWKPYVRWYWGPAGCGKSRKARENYEGMDLFTKNTATKWWEGYDRHEAVIIDDFRPTWWRLTEMLRILDRYECRIEYKGGSRQLVAKHITITSDRHPRDCYIQADVGGQLLRRIDEIVEFTE